MKDVRTVTARQAAQQLGVSPAQLAAWARDGRVTMVQEPYLGIRYIVDEIDALAELL